MIDTNLWARRGDEDAGDDWRAGNRDPVTTADIYDALNAHHEIDLRNLFSDVERSEALTTMVTAYAESFVGRGGVVL